MTTTSTPLWTAEDAIAAMEAEARGHAAWQAHGVSIDTRTIEAGDIFFALEGDASDGHDYVAQALGKGAACAVVSRAVEGLADDAPLLMVPDTLKALEKLGIAARARTSASICAVTGSVGKTGTKEALRHILEEQGRTHASAASYNNHIGVPLTLARMPADTEYGIFEIGMNHADEITPLSKMVRPEAAIITTVEAVHIENFGSVEEIADAKGEIFEGLQTGGVAILNRDNPHFERLKARAGACGAGQVIGFGQDDMADARVQRMSLKPDASYVTATICGMDITYKLGVPGKHIVMNSLAILACVKSLGADLALAGLALGELEPPAGRGSRLEVRLPRGRFLIIDESYNANPTSMRATLQALGNTPPGPRGRRIAVVGDMLELGTQAKAAHAGLAEPIAENDVDLVFACGPLMEHLWDALPTDQHGAYADNSADLAPRVADEVEAGDVVMIKGSFGSRMARVLEALKALGPAAPPRRTTDEELV
ncbi:UDP-N-acetylmuramoylalanyl-D-glutamyl-2,6-diaminopimelate--D-alanyl-D-alanine ligase [Pyruvatibacter mobilis]|uniref:UDP-N-acetylmuramoylalanyl-D-glutamyl-2, 6-diaminopimelate--D-alanyl-D-alanine ligase n=1 Tax=Pyruvatibacter mobilis TaxID=1712261 RepID=UPI003BACC6CA